MSYKQADSTGVHSPGHDCTNCGRPGYEHEKTVVAHENGRKRYSMECPQ